MRGGIDSIHFGKSSLPPSIFILEQQTVSHMKAKMWHPIKVAEVEIRASGGRRSGQGPGKNKFDQKFWYLQFLSYTNVIHLKRKLSTIVI